jgi:MFS transporter, PAT family, beta-lactamase induction signal transducer AmpG
MTVTIISFLTSMGIPDGSIGRLSAFIAGPWALKLIWAPVIDTISYPPMGRRRPWIICAQAMMVLTLVGFLFVDDPVASISLLGWLFFVHNCFAALQDVLTDALAIEVVPPHELGTINGLMMAAKMLGIGLGAAGLAGLMATYGLTAAVIAQVFVLLLIMMLPIFFIESPGEKRMPWSRGLATPSRGIATFRNPFKVIRDLFWAFSKRSVICVALLGFLASVAEWIIEVINKPFFTKVLGWTYVEFSAISGTLVIFQFCAALAGGWAARRFGFRSIIVAGLGAYGVIATSFGLFNWLFTGSIGPTTFLLLLPATNAFGSVAFYAIAMRLSRTDSAATVFTTVMAITSFGHVVGGVLIGPLRDDFALDYRTLYMLGGSLMVACLIFLIPLDVANPFVDDEQAVASHSIFDDPAK